MAWVRTATSLISFGFTIYKFFEFESGRNLTTGSGLLSPRIFAMLMIGTGLFALAFSTIEHRHSIQMLRAEFGPARRSVAGLVAAIVAVMGVLAFVATLFRG